MKIEDIEKFWDSDSIVDKAHLDDEALKIPQLHNKYQKLFRKAKAELRQLEVEKKKVYSLLYEYWTGGFNTNATALALLQKPIQPKKLLKDAVERNIQQEDSYIDACNAVSEQEDLIDYIVEIVKQINNRSFQIKNSLEFLKWTKGDG
jgi:hypothetical protein